VRRKHIIAAIIGASLLLLFLTLQGILRGIVFTMQADEAAANVSSALVLVFLHDGLQMAIIGGALGVCTVMLWDGLQIAIAWLRSNLSN
jgi:hypothetical protein